MCVYKPFVGQAWSRFHHPQSSFFANRTGESGYRRNCHTRAAAPSAAGPGHNASTWASVRRVPQLQPRRQRRSFSTSDLTATVKSVPELTGTQVNWEGREVGGLFFTQCFTAFPLMAGSRVCRMNCANLNAWDLLRGHRGRAQAPGDGQTQDRQTRAPLGLAGRSRAPPLCCPDEASGLCHQAANAQVHWQW